MHLELNDLFLKMNRGESSRRKTVLKTNITGNYRIAVHQHFYSLPFIGHFSIGIYRNSNMKSVFSFSFWTVKYSTVVLYQRRSKPSWIALQEKALVTGEPRAQFGTCTRRKVASWTEDYLLRSGYSYAEHPDRVR